MKFASFGLGDTSYPKFNWAHRKLYNRLIQLGAQPICDRGESDEQQPEGWVIFSLSQSSHAFLCFTAPMIFIKINQSLPCWSNETDLVKASMDPLSHGPSNSDNAF
jgi:sulfite reductase alpha subunit-like flavoprotein